MSKVNENCGNKKCKAYDETCYYNCSLSLFTELYGCEIFKQEEKADVHKA